MVQTIIMSTEIVTGTVYRIEVELDVEVIDRVPHIKRTKIQAIKDIKMAFTNRRNGSK
jgi:hypothetical protein